MPTFGPIKRRELIRYLRQVGFSVVPIRGVNINLCSKDIYGFAFPIHTGVT